MAPEGVSQRRRRRRRNWSQTLEVGTTSLRLENVCFWEIILRTKIKLSHHYLHLRQGHRCYLHHHHHPHLTPQFTSTHPLRSSRPLSVSTSCLGVFRCWWICRVIPDSVFVELFFPPLTVIPRLVPVADTARLTWVSQGCPSDSGRFRGWAQFRARDTGPGRVPVMLSSEASCSYRSLLRKSSRSTDLKTSRRPVRHIQAKVCAAPCRDAAVMDKVFVESAPIRSGSCVVRVACVRENPLLDVRQSGPEPSLWDAPAHPRFSRPSTLSLLSVSALLSGLTHPY